MRQGLRWESGGGHRSLQRGLHKGEESPRHRKLQEVLHPSSFLID